MEMFDLVQPQDIVKITPQVFGLDGYDSRKGLSILMTLTNSRMTVQTFYGTNVKTFCYYTKQYNKMWNKTKQNEIYFMELKQKFAKSYG